MLRCYKLLIWLSLLAFVSCSPAFMLLYCTLVIKGKDKQIMEKYKEVWLGKKHLGLCYCVTHTTSSGSSWRNKWATKPTPRIRMPMLTSFHNGR